jgi:dTDP-4-amino-4,6-dideoxygalactose transaminase
MNVPFLDLKAQYASIKGEINAAIQEVLDSCAFAGGPFVEKFEKEWASYCGVKYAVGVGSGTDALWLALLALGVGPGDEVITVPNSFLATAEAISLAGATPVFVDVDPRTYTMDPALVEAAITKRTRAIIPVHIFGQTADMDPIMEIARCRSIAVLEDACQAHGAEYKGKRAGSIGDAGCFSFYPGKNLGAYGEAGAIVTGGRQLSDHVRMLRDHGQVKKYYHKLVGCNGRMDGLQGAILSVKLKYLDGWNDARRKVAVRYRELLKGAHGLTLPEEVSYGTHVYHVFAIRAKERERIIEKLHTRGVHCGIHYPVPIHLQEAYRSLGLGKASFPVLEKCAEEFISLPMFAELDGKQIAFVSSSLRELIAHLAEFQPELIS